MHGKISYYSPQNGLGTITNQNKRVFELKRNSWHDPRTIPSIGMYVVFRYDEREGVTDCKASYCQSFDENIFITEADFWDTEDDHALQDIEERRQEDLILSEMAKVDLRRLKIVKPNRSIASCLANHFHHHLEIIEKNSTVVEEKSSAQRLDYFLIKRFLEKALSQLLFIDKRISLDEFNVMKQKLVELEYLYKTFIKAPKVSNEELLNEVFLKYQITFLAIQKKLKSLEENSLAHKSKIKSFDSEIKVLQMKLEECSSENSAQLIKDKIDAIKEKKQEIIARSGPEIKIYEKVKGLCDKFIAYHTEEVPNSYMEMRNKIKDEIKDIIDSVAYDLDFAIWQKAMASESVQSTFYRQDIDGSFCSMTFLRYYLKRLDMSKMQNNDKVLYGMMVDFDRNRSRRFAVVTETYSVAKKVKMYILSANKDYRVVVANRPIEFLNVIKNDRFDVILIDKHSKSMDALELMLKCKEQVPKNVKFILFDE